MHHHDVSCFVHTFPLFRSVQCYAYHVCLRHLLVFYASLHTFLHVHAWVLLASVSSNLNLHLSLVDNTYCLPFRLFVFFLVCSFAYLLSWFLTCLFILWLAMSLAICYACHIYLACLLCTICALPTLLFLSIACLLVSCLCLCMYTYRARTHGARARSPRHKQKGKDASMWI